MCGPHLKILSFFIFLAVVQAGFHIDDANATIRYTSTATREGLWLPLNLTNGNGVMNHNGSMMLIDYGRLFNQTVTFAKCNGTDLCEIGIPFTGSGITLYGIVIDTLNFTVSIDENPAPPPDLWAPPLNTAPLIYNTSLYNIQSLPFAFHFLTLTLIDWIDSPDPSSLIMFDYAYINDTRPSPSTTGSNTTSSTASSTPSHSNSKSHSTVGIAVGITIVAIIICAAVIFGLVRRHKSRARNTRPVPFVAETAPIEPPRPAAPVQKPIEVEVPAQAMAQSNANQLMILTNQNDSGSGVASPISPISPIQRDRVTSGAFPDRSTFLSTGARLTADQTDFVHNLYSLNVPAPAIAQVMQKMITETQDTSGSTSPQEAPFSDIREVTAPPSYEAS